MRRRLVIFGSALAAYAVLMAVTWVVGTRQAEDKTEMQLAYAVLDLHDTVAGAIDTMLSHVAGVAVRVVGSPHVLPMSKMDGIAQLLDIDELNIVNRDGEIIASNDSYCMGVRMAGDPVMDEFMKLTNGVAVSVSQPFRQHARNPQFRAKYLAVPFPGGNGFVQVGLDERRLARMLPELLGFIFDEWLLGRTGFFLCANAETGVLVSNPSRHRDEARTIAEAGYDIAGARDFEILADGKAESRTFTQRLFGEKCYCRAMTWGGHRFVAALPEREFYDTRTAYVSVFAVLMFVIIGAFAFFLDRIFRYSDTMNALYAAEDERRAKEMEIAKTIQNSALPSAPPESPSFRMYATMQAARDVGGDFYDYFALDATHVAFLVADVSGKGVTAALYMMTSKTLIKDTLVAVRDPALALTKVNSELCGNNPANMFLTAWVGVVDLETGVVTFANAGHNPPVALPGGTFVTEMSGPVLAFVDGVKYKSHTLRLAPGDSMFLYTDGVTEALDANDGLFGEERLVDALKASPKAEPASLCAVVRAVTAAFSAGVPQADDITVLALKYVAPPRVFSRTFPPTNEGIAAASDYLDQVDCASAEEMAALHVILDEICSNIVKHSGASGFEVSIEALGGSDGVKMTFTDDGVAYDPLSHVDPDTTLPADRRPIGGLGIMMVKRMATSVSYRRDINHNQLTVVRARGGQAADRKG